MDEVEDEVEHEMEREVDDSTRNEQLSSFKIKELDYISNT